MAVLVPAAACRAAIWDALAGQGVCADAPATWPPLADPHVYFTESGDHGVSWTTPQQIETPGDRGFYTAPAISPTAAPFTSHTTPLPRRTRPLPAAHATWWAWSSRER